VQLDEVDQTPICVAVEWRNALMTLRNGHARWKGIAFEKREWRHLQYASDAGQLFSLDRSLVPLDVRHGTRIDAELSGELL